MNPFSFRVILRFFPGSLDPKAICAELALEPDRLEVMGEPRKTFTGKLLSGTYEYSLCQFEPQQNKGEDLNEMLDRVCNSLLPHQDLIRRIRDVGGRVEFYVYWFSIDNSGDTFSWELINKLGKLGIDLVLDVYGQDDPFLKKQ